MDKSDPSKSIPITFQRIFSLLAYALLGLFAFALLGISIVAVFYGSSGVRALLSGDLSYIGAVKWMLVAQQLGLFLFSALAWAFWDRMRFSSIFGLQRPTFEITAMVVALSFLLLPLIELTYAWNQQLVLPDFLQSIEQWMRSKEDDAAATTAAILKMTSPIGLWLNLIVVAVVPAVCEEFFFRGAIQKIIFDVKQNPHVAIWLAAFIFSAIHFQFFGFLPRLLLGAVFGYIYYWSGSIWYAVIAHFFNNGIAVMQAYFVQSNANQPAKAAESDFPWFVYLIYIIITVILLVVLKRLAEKQKNQHLLIPTDEN